MKNISLIVSLFCLCGCSSINRVADLNPDKAPRKSFDITKVAQNIRYIPLEAGPEHFSNPLAAFVEAGDFYYVSDNFTLLQYDKNGKFIRTIGDWGIEPGEYGTLLWMDAAPGHNSLFVRTLDDMLIFDANGKLLDRMQIDSPYKLADKDGKSLDKNRRFYMSAFFITKRGLFLFKNLTSLYSNVAIRVCNEQLDSLGGIGYRVNKEHAYYSIIPRFATDRKNYFYREEFSDTLYMITPRLKSIPYAVGCGVPDIASRPVLYLPGNFLYDRRSGNAIQPEEGICFQHIRWSPVAGVGKRLFFQALVETIIDNKKYITDPRLKKISETLTPDSGVVLVELKVRNLKL